MDRIWGDCSEARRRPPHARCVALGDAGRRRLTDLARSHESHACRRPAALPAVLQQYGKRLQAYAPLLLLYAYKVGPHEIFTRKAAGALGPDTKHIWRVRVGTLAGA